MGAVLNARQVEAQAGLEGAGTRDTAKQPHALKNRALITIT